MKDKREEVKASPIWRAGVVCKDTKEVCHSYEEYGKSLHWGKTRIRKIKSLRGDRCEACKRKHINMQVHHLTYENIGNEKLEDLKILCPSCHARAHGKEIGKVSGNHFYEGDFYGIHDIDNTLERLYYG